jgi:cyclophilin family peptidyl-prolyl cis-trans isomerase
MPHRAPVRPLSTQPGNASDQQQAPLGSAHSARSLTGWLTAGGLLAFAGTFLGVIYITSSRRRDAEAVRAQPVLDGNPIVFLDIEDRGKPVGRLVVQLRADAAPRLAEAVRRLCVAPMGYGYMNAPLHGLDKGARIYGGDWFGCGAGSYNPLTGAAGGIPVGAADAAAASLPHCGPGAVGLRPLPPLRAPPGRDGDPPQLQHQVSSQFYVTLRRMPHLDGVPCGGVVVGYLLEGFELLELLDKAGLSDGRFQAAHDFRIARCGQLTGQERARYVAGGRGGLVGAAPVEGTQGPPRTLDGAPASDGDGVSAGVCATLVGRR